MNLSYRDYVQACNEAFTANMSNPSVFWNSENGFYVAPSSDLAPNDDLCIGLAYYSANSGARSLSGSRREYQPIMRGIKNAARNNSNLIEAIRDAQFEADYADQVQP